MAHRDEIMTRIRALSPPEKATLQQLMQQPQIAALFSKIMPDMVDVIQSYAASPPNGIPAGAAAAPMSGGGALPPGGGALGGGY